MLDLEKFVAGVQDYIGKALQPLAARLKALEDRPPPKDGKDADPQQIADAVAEAIKSIPAPTPITVDDMRPLVDEAVSDHLCAYPSKAIEAALALYLHEHPAKGVTQAEIREVVAEAVATIPKPKDGVSVTLEDVRPVVRQAISEMPPAKDGKDGATAAEIREIVAEAVKAIPPPKDGESVTVEQVVDVLAPTMEAKMAAWALDFERRAQGVLERAVDRIPRPKDGDNGLDGLGFDDMAVLHDGERGFTFRFSRGERVKDYTFTIPCVIDRGVFKEGTEYADGDGATWGGSYWIAQVATKEKPGTGADWRLAVKRGRAGRDSTSEKA